MEQQEAPMPRSEILRRFKKAVNFEFDIAEDEMDLATSLSEDLQADQWVIAEFTIVLQEEFNLSLELDDVDRCTTLGDWLALVEKELYT